MYCELIDPQTVEPIVGEHPVKDFGGPAPKSEHRMFNCNLYLADEREDSIAVFVFELGSAENKKKEQARASTNLSELPKEHPEYFSSLEDGGDIGYAWYADDTAAANLLTDERHISVTVPATAEQAAAFTPLMLKVAQEIDRNLDAWDAEHGS